MFSVNTIVLCLLPNPEKSARLLNSLTPSYSIQNHIHHSSFTLFSPFGRVDLIDGLSFLLLAMATFALAEALMSVLTRKQEAEKVEKVNVKKIGDLDYHHIDLVEPATGTP